MMNSSNSLLLQLPSDSLLVVGALLPNQDLSNLIDSICRQFTHHALWLQVIRLLVHGRHAHTILPTRLGTIIQEQLNLWETSVNGDTRKIQKSFQDVILPVFQYSGYAMKISYELGGNPKNRQVVWPMACGSCGADAYPWPPVVFSTPYFSSEVLSWASSCMPKHQSSESIILHGGFVTREHIQHSFHPDENMGVLTWNTGDEDFMHPSEANSTAKNYQLLIQYGMLILFQSQENSRQLIWAPERVLQNHSDTRNVMLEPIQQSSTCSWLSQTTIESQTAPRKHSVCFWVKTEQPQENDQQRKSNSRNQAQAPVNFDSDDYILERVRKLVAQLSIPPPLHSDLFYHVGDWALVEACNEVNQAVTIPNCSGGKAEFVLKLRQMDGNDYQLSMSIQVGNHKGAMLTFLDKEGSGDGKAIHVSSMHSTMMCCPALRDFERFIENSLSNAKTLQLIKKDDEADKLILFGIGSNKLVFVRNAEAESRTRAPQEDVHMPR